MAEARAAGVRWEELEAVTRAQDRAVQSYPV